MYVFDPNRVETTTESSAEPNSAREKNYVFDQSTNHAKAKRNSVSVM